MHSRTQTCPYERIQGKDFDSRNQFVAVSAIVQDKKARYTKIKSYVVERGDS